MLFLLSWRWLRCYAWCTLRVTFGAALRSDAIRDGASFVRLASYPRDYFGSPRLEPGFPPPRLGFHPTSEGYPIGDLGKWLSLVSPQCPACSCMTGALSVALCGARPRPSSEVILHLAQPLVGYGVKYTGLVPRSYCLARSVHWHSWLHRLGVRWTLPWTLPWLPCASVYSNPHVACFSPCLLLCIRRALSIGPWLRSPCCAPCSTQGAFPLRPRCLPHRLAARSARALPWPASLFVAWRASHPWAEDFACSLVGRVATPTSVDASRLIRLFRAIWKDDKCEGYVRSASPSVWPVVCLLPPGVPRTGLGSPPTRLRLSLYVNRGVARHEWLAAPMHGSLEGPRMGPGSLHLYLGVFLTTSGTSISGYSTHSLSLASP
ncbi:hypothetical protein V6N13_090932 [Hibiscus sabdariffa]